MKLRTQHARKAVAPTSFRRLDLFIVRDPNSVKAYTKSEEPFAAGHDFIHLLYDLTFKPEPPKHIYIRNLKQLNHDFVNKSFSNVFSQNAYTATEPEFTSTDYIQPSESSNSYTPVNSYIYLALSHSSYDNLALDSNLNSRLNSSVSNQITNDYFFTCSPNICHQSHVNQLTNQFTIACLNVFYNIAPVHEVILDLIISLE